MREAIGPEVDTWNNLIELYVHQPRLKAKAKQIAGDCAGIVDLSNLVVEALIRAAQKYDPKAIANLKAWITKIVANDVFARLRLAEVRMRNQQAPDLGKLAGEFDEASSRLERCEKEAYLYRLLEQLSDSDRELLCLSRIEEIPDTELAEMLGVTEQTLRQRRSRAMNKLKELAQRHPFEE